MESELRSISKIRAMYQSLSFVERLRLLSHASFYGEDWEVVLRYFPSFHSARELRLVHSLLKQHIDECVKVVMYYQSGTGQAPKRVQKRFFTE